MHILVMPPKPKIPKKKKARRKPDTLTEIRTGAGSVTIAGIADPLLIAAIVQACQSNGPAKPKMTINASSSADAVVASKLAAIGK